MRYTGCSRVSPQQTLRAEPFIPAAVTSRPWPLQLRWEDLGVGKHSCVGPQLLLSCLPFSPFLLPQASPLLVLSCSP